MRRARRVTLPAPALPGVLEPTRPSAASISGGLPSQRSVETRLARRFAVPEVRASRASPVGIELLAVDTGVVASADSYLRVAEAMTVWRFGSESMPGRPVSPM